MSLSFTRKFASVFVGLPLLAAAVVGGTATSASAHHANVTASADCSGRVAFTATSWSTGAEGTNSKIGVSYSVDGSSFVAIGNDSGSKIVSSNGVTFAFNAANAYKFSDSIDIANPKAGSKVAIKVQPLAAWGNGVVSQPEETAMVTLTDTCPQPKASVTGPDCKSDSAVVVLRNDGGQKASFNILTDGKAFKSVEVAGGQSQSVSVVVPAGSSVKITVTSADKTLNESTISRAADCLAPQAAIDAVCKVDGSGWNVTYKNSGKIDDTFSLVSDGKLIDEVKLEAGKSITKSYKFNDFSISATKAVRLQVKAGGNVIADQSVTNNCNSATAVAAVKCDVATHGAVVMLINKGNLDETFTISRDGKSVDGMPVVVKPGGSATHIFPMNEDQSATFSVTSAESKVNMERKLTLDCAPAVVTEVLDEQITPPTTAPAVVAAPAVLAHTGADNMVFQSMLGLLLLGLGYVLVVLGRPLIGAHYRR